MSDPVFNRLGQNGSEFVIDRKVGFIYKNQVRYDFVKASANFAYLMADNHLHREHRSGGSVCRNKLDVFFNAFSGKLGEFAFYQYWQDKPDFECSMPDTDIYERGKWDTGDLYLKEISSGRTSSISIKSVKFFSNLLLLETGDWDSNGYYIPDKVSGDSDAGYYDVFALVRLGSRTFNYGRWCFANKVWMINGSEETANILSVLHNLCVTSNWYFDIPGCIIHSDLVRIIRDGFILPKGSVLKGKTNTVMDASNYYVQAGDLRQFVS